MDVLLHHPQQSTLIPSPNSSSNVNKKKSRLSYSITFKLAAVRHAESHGNRATARYLGINEKQIRDWRSKKTSLMSTNANAKRLKGAGRQGGGETKNRHKSTNSLPTNVNLKAKVQPFTPSPPSHRYDFSWWRQCLPRSNTTILKDEIHVPQQQKSYATLSPQTQTAQTNNNNNYVRHSIKSIMASSHTSPTKAESSSQPTITSQFHHHSPTKKNDQEFKDKVSCALALLELKKTNTQSFFMNTHQWLQSEL
uniref:Brinker DNA-binding domain-containing protein n=1 Tax=Clytia hemisphaerica TaxID=252671 RepID=A0A7M5XBY2_9CNID|eukprot:TCONS_00056345-protein